MEGDVNGRGYSKDAAKPHTQSWRFSTKPKGSQCRNRAITGISTRTIPTFSRTTRSNFFYGSKFREKSVIFGVIGFFFLGIVFGPLAISNANKAEALHHSATLGKVLGWIDTIAGVVWLLVFVLVVISSNSGT
jgi:hypothetical protein